MGLVVGALSLGAVFPFIVAIILVLLVKGVSKLFIAFITWLLFAIAFSFVGNLIGVEISSWIPTMVWAAWFFLSK